MRRWIHCTVMLLTFCYGSFAHAEVLVSESFDYDPGFIDGSEGGTGWGDIWIVSDGLIDTEFKLDVIEPADPLVYAFPDGGFVNGGNRALQFKNADPEATVANETNALTRPFEDVIDTDSLYFSYLYRYDGDGSETGGFINDNDFVVWWFNGTSGPQLGLKGNGGNGSVPDDFVGRVSGAFAPPQQAYAPGIDISADAGTLNDTWFVVGKMSKSDHSLEEGDFDQFDLWINPGTDGEATPNATATGAEGDSLEFELDQIGLRIFSEEPGDAMSWDELRIGENWEDVVSVLGDQDIVVAPTCTIPADGILGDLDGSGDVGFADFLLLSGNFGNTGLAYEQGDVDCDGTVAFADFLTLSGNFGKTAEGAHSVPEPSGFALFSSFALFGLIRRRRSR